jgi:hypothetical protein
MGRVGNHVGVDLSDVTAVVRELRDNGVRVWLFGGWAEESLGLIPPRPHKDVDFLYPANDFGALDAFMANTGVREFEVKRSPCSRGFDRDGHLVEFYLVRRDAQGPYTDFWGYVHRWPLDTLDDGSEFPVASATALTSARSVWADVEQSYESWPKPTVPD